jgi:uncharacterized protein with HEPN domain
MGFFEIGVRNRVVHDYMNIDMSMILLSGIDKANDVRGNGLK